MHEGGGTFDVSIVKIVDTVFMVRATSGDTRLGGKDFDERMVKYIVQDIKSNMKEDITKNSGNMSRLRIRCNKIKENLSFSSECDGEFFGLLQDRSQEYDFTFTRELFEDINKDLFSETIKIVEKCLLDAQLHKTEIDEIVLVGGSSRIPKVQQLLQEYFGDKPLKHCINPEEAIAHGAALQAHILIHGDLKCKLVIEDVTSLSLGLEVVGGKFDVFIPRNTSIPHNVIKTVGTSYKDQTEILISIYQGEKTVAVHNHYLGQFRIGNIPKKKKGKEKFNIIFDLDENGILHVRATDRNERMKGDIHLGLKENKLSEEELAKIIIQLNKMFEK